MLYKITDVESKRINIVKVWFTIMVVFIHSYSETINLTSGNVNLEVPLWLEIMKYSISRCVSSCAVPGFFFISAVLLYRKEFAWKDNLKKKIKTLLLPYFLINSFWILFYYICQQIPLLSDYFSNSANMVGEWNALNWLNAYGVLANEPLCYPLWFIRNLFILNIFSIVIKMLIDRFPKLLLALLAFIWLVLDGSYMTQAICFWGLGYFWVKSKLQLSILDKHKRLIAISYIILIVLDVFVREMVVYRLIYRLIHRLCTVVGIAFWYTCLTNFKSVNFNKLLLHLSAYSFSIYLFHEMCLSILKKICVKIFPTTVVFQLLEYILIPFIVIGGCLVVSVGLKKVVPRFYSVLTGNRAS